MDGETQAPWSGPFGRWLGEISVPMNGFRWISGEGWEYQDLDMRGLSVSDVGPYLVPADGLEAPTRDVDLLNDPHRVQELGDPDRVGFHRRFARLADGREATRQERVRKFANRYGFLSSTPEGLMRREPVFESVKGERWETWESAIFEAAALVSLWDHVMMRNEKALTPLVEWYERPYAQVACVYRQGLVLSTQDFCRVVGGDEWRGGVGCITVQVCLDECDGDYQLWGGDPVEAVREAIYQCVMFHLDGQVSPYLSRHADAELWYTPRSLHAAVYVHLAREISGRQRLSIQCANTRCGQYFAPDRGNAQYCSKRCRQQAHYYRRVEMGN